MVCRSCTPHPMMDCSAAGSGAEHRDMAVECDVGDRHSTAFGGTLSEPGRGSRDGECVEASAETFSQLVATVIQLSQLDVDMRYQDVALDRAL